MSVSSESRPSDTVDSPAPPITNDSETSVVPQSTHDDQPSEAAKAHTTTMADTVQPQEAAPAGAEAVVNIPAENGPPNGVERVVGAVDDKAETGVEGSESKESTLLTLQPTSLASEPPQVTESNSADSTPIVSEEPREDTKEAAATASTTLSVIEAQEAPVAHDTKEEEKATDQPSESAPVERDATQETSDIALSPTQEFTSPVEQTTGKPPATPPLTIQLDAAKPFEGVILAESLDDLSSNQADKANEEGPEIPIESEMTFASPVSPIVVARAVSVGGEESVPGTPVSETYSDAGTRESTPGPEDGAPRARTKAEKKRAKRLRQKQASKDAAAMKSELEAAEIEIPPVPAPVEEAKDEPAPAEEVKDEPTPIEEKAAAPIVEEPVVEAPVVEEAPHAVRDEPSPEKDVKETEPELVETQVEETVAETVPSPEDEAKVDASAPEPTQEPHEAELAVEDVQKVDAVVEEPVIEEAPKVEAVVEEVAPEVEPAQEPPVEERTDVEEEPKGEVVVEEQASVDVEEPVKVEEIKPEADDLKEEVTEPETVEEPTKVEVEDVPKVEEQPEIEEPESKEPAKAVEEEEAKAEPSVVEVEKPVTVEEEGEAKVEEPVEVQEEEVQETPKEVEEPVKVEEIKVEEPMKVEEDVKVEEPAKGDDAKVEEDIKVEEGAKEDDAKVEQPVKEEDVKAEEVKVEEPVTIEEPTKTEEEVKAEEPAKIEEDVHASEPVKVEEEVQLSPPSEDVSPVAEQVDEVSQSEPGVELPVQEEAREEKPDITESTQEEKVEAPSDIGAGLVEPVSTPAILEDDKAVASGPPQSDNEEIPAPEVAEAGAIVAATAEKLEIPTGLVEPIASPALDQEHVEEKHHPIVDEIDAALEDVKVGEVAEEINEALEEVKDEELVAIPAISEVIQAEDVTAIEENADKVEAAPIVEQPEVVEPSKQEATPIEETKVDDEPTIEPAAEEPSPEEDLQPEQPAELAKAATDALAAPAQEPERALEKPDVEEPVLQVEEASVPTHVQEEPAVEDVQVEPESTERAIPQDAEEPTKLDEVLAPEVSVAEIEVAAGALPEEAAQPLEKAVEEVVDAVPQDEVSQGPEQSISPMISHTATSTESTDSPIAPATPSVVVEDLEPVQEKAALVPQTLERPKSPFSPSFSVTTVGGAVAEVETSPAEPETEEAAPSLATDNVKSSELSVTPPARPWTPSYSVHSQGSPLQHKVTLDDDVPAEPLSTEPLEEIKTPAEGPVEATAEEPLQPAPAADSLTKEAAVSPAPPSVEETQAPEENITAPVPLIAPIPLAGSSWVPSYSVSRQGSPLPKTPEPVEKSLPQEEPSVQVPVAAESFWSGVKAVEDGKEAAETTEIQVPESAVLRDAPATEPTVAPASNSLAPPETPPRARVESNSSTTTKLLPGGWFSPRKGSHDSRPSLETASGQFVPSQGFSSPIDSAPVLPPIATENLNVPSHEMGQNSASPSKKRWCTIM